MKGFIEADRTRIEDRMNFTRENYRMMREELLKIVYWTPDDGLPGMPKPLAHDRIEAAKNVVMMDLAGFSPQIMRGIMRAVGAIMRSPNMHRRAVPPRGGF